MFLFDSDSETSFSHYEGAYLAKMVKNYNGRAREKSMNTMKQSYRNLHCD